MRKPIIPGLILSFLMMAPGFTGAAEITEFSANADCTGWNATATFAFADGEFFTDMDYSVSLVDPAGGTMEYANWSGSLSRMEEAVIIKMYSDSWGEDLTENYTARFVFHLSGTETVFETDVACGTADGGDGGDGEVAPEPCHLPYYWWRRHTDQWPVQSLILGDMKMSQAELVQSQRGRNRFDRRMPLVRQIIAAKLNLANGASDDILPHLDAADDFLREYPLDRRVSRRQMRRLRREIHALRAPLRDYNRLGCPDGTPVPGGCDADAGNADKAAMSTSDSTFENIKAMYR